VFNKPFLLSHGQRAIDTESFKVSKNTGTRGGFGDNQTNQRVLCSLSYLFEYVSDAAYPHQYFRKSTGPVMPIIVGENIDTYFG
jgi:hypothetical protein